MMGALDNPGLSRTIICPHVTVSPFSCRNNCLKLEGLECDVTVFAITAESEEQASGSDRVLQQVKRYFFLFFKNIFTYMCVYSNVFFLQQMLYIFNMRIN